MQYMLDIHTHTTASGHAYSSIQEMLQEAQNKKLALLGISEHAPAMPGTCSEIYFQNLRVIPRQYDNLELLLGAEVNILDYNGSLDLSPATLATLDYCIASLHTPCILSGTADENTKAYLNAIQNPYINIIGHPDDARYPIHYKELVMAAKKHHVLLEVNNSSLSPKSFRANAHDNYLEMLKLCKEYQAPILLGSDAHISYDVGNFTYAQALITEIDFPSNLIANTSIEKFKSFLSIKSK